MRVHNFIYNNAFISMYFHTGKDNQEYKPGVDLFLGDQGRVPFSFCYRYGKTMVTYTCLRYSK